MLPETGALPTQHQDLWAPTHNAHFVCMTLHYTRWYHDSGANIYSMKDAGMATLNTANHYTKNSIAPIAEDLEKYKAPTENYGTSVQLEQQNGQRAEIQWRLHTQVRPRLRVQYI